MPKICYEFVHSRRDGRWTRTVFLDEVSSRTRAIGFGVWDHPSCQMFENQRDGRVRPSEAWHPLERADVKRRGSGADVILSQIVDAARVGIPSMGVKMASL